MKDQPNAGGQAVDAEPVLTLIQKIKDKKLDPKMLAIDDRRRCVEVLRAEGYSVPEIAQILRHNERTIYRDQDAIRTEHALDPDPDFPARMAGELVRQCETSMSRLRRIAREAGASAMERLMAEGQAWRCFKEMIEKLQSLGHLPRVPSTVVADVFQRFEADPIAGYDELANRIQAIEQIEQQTGMDDPHKHQRRRQLLDEVRRGQISAQINGLTAQESSVDRGKDHEGN